MRDADPARPSRDDLFRRGEERVRDPGARYEVADGLDQSTGRRPCSVQAVVLVRGVAGQVGVQPDVELSASAATDDISRFVAPNTECGPSAMRRLERGPRS